MIQLAKLFFKSFCHGLNCGDLEEKILKMTNELSDPMFIFYDGASYDAHQH